MSIQEELSRCKEYSGKIMDDISDILYSHKYNFEIDDSKSEIIIPDTQDSKDEIETLIESSLTIPKMITGMMVQVKKVKQSVFIRLILK